MAAPRKPQDNLPKKGANGFKFTHNGEEFELADAAELLTVGYARKNRHLSETNQLFNMLEVLAGPEALDAIDSMHKDEFTQFQRDLMAHNGAQSGESEASSAS